jgi:hypothetical protein
MKRRSFITLLGGALRVSIVSLRLATHGAIRLASKVRGIGYTTRCKMLYSDKSS